MASNSTRQTVRRPSLKVVVPVILFATYYPYSWLILSKGTWTDQRWTWILMWPALPGLIPRMAFFHHLSDVWMLLAMLVISSLLVVLLIYLASRRYWLFVLVATLTFFLSALNSMLAYRLYRM